MQGTKVINSFPWAYGLPCFYCEGNLAVTNVVSTNWFGSEYVSGTTAGQYTLSGTPTGTSWTGTPPPAGEAYNSIYDGTSDGTHNYTVEYETPDWRIANVIQTDLNWQHPVVLFRIPGGTYGTELGVTYDPRNNSLWIGGVVGEIKPIGRDVITDYSLTGTLLSSFSTGEDYMAALGFDPGDGTLWFSDDRSPQLYQYSTSGELLQQGTPSGLPYGTYFAGEFAELVPSTPSSVPEPATLFLLGTGLFGLDLMRWRKAA